LSNYVLPGDDFKRLQQKGNLNLFFFSFSFFLFAQREAIKGSGSCSLRLMRKKWIDDVAKRLFFPHLSLFSRLCLQKKKKKKFVLVCDVIARDFEKLYQLINRFSSHAFTSLPPTRKKPSDLQEDASTDFESRLVKLELEVAQLRQSLSSLHSSDTSIALLSTTVSDRSILQSPLPPPPAPPLPSSENVFKTPSKLISIRSVLKNQKSGASKKNSKHLSKKPLQVAFNPAEQLKSLRSVSDRKSLGKENQGNVASSSSFVVTVDQLSKIRGKLRKSGLTPKEKKRSSNMNDKENQGENEMLWAQKLKLRKSSIKRSPGGTPLKVSGSQKSRKNALMPIPLGA